MSKWTDGQRLILVKNVGLNRGTLCHQRFSLFSQIYYLGCWIRQQPKENDEEAIEVEAIEVHSTLQ